MFLLPSVTFIWQFKFFHKFLCLFYLWTVKYKYSKLQLFTGSSLFWFVSYWCISKLMWTSVDNGHTLSSSTISTNRPFCSLCRGMKVLTNFVWVQNCVCGCEQKKRVYTTICVFFNRHVHHMTFFCVAKIFGMIKLFMTILMYKHKSMTPSPAVYASVVSKHVTFLYTLL